MSKQGMRKIADLLKAYRETGNVNFLLRASKLTHKGKTDGKTKV